MGWLSNVGRSINRGFNDLTRTISSPGRIVDDPLGTLKNYTLPGLVGNSVSDASKNDVKKMISGVKDPIGSYMAGSSGGLLGNVAHNSSGINVTDMITGGGGPEPPKAGQDPRLTDIQNQMAEDAKNYRSNIEGENARKMAGLLPAYAQAKEEGTRKTRENYGRRGLLYSGLREKGEGEVRGSLAAEMSKAKTDIRSETENIAQAKERAAAMIGLENAAQMMSSIEQYYNISQQNDLARRKSLGLIGQGLGAGIGAYAGRNSGGVSTVNNYNNYVGDINAGGFGSYTS